MISAAPGQDFPSMTRTFRAFTRTKNAPIVNAMRRVLTSIRTDAKARIPADGLGRRIWGKKSSGLNALLKRVTVRAQGDGFSGGLQVHGLAGLIEKGGTTLDHTIKAKPGGVLARRPGFFARGRRRDALGGVQTAIVKHPGGPVAQKARALEAVEAARPRFLDQISQAVREALEKAAADA